MPVRPRTSSAALAAALALAAARPAPVAAEEPGAPAAAPPATPAASGDGERPVLGEEPPVGEGGAQGRAGEQAAAPEGLGEDISVLAPTRLPRRRGRGDGLSVSTVGRDELRSDAPRSVQEALGQVPGVHLADEQGNPFQQDLSMRGLVASPVTGLSQGLSVFVDGVRVNEPGVEEVNFDLLPLEDAERIEVIRGPHAIFGRNTLGGAIHLVTQRGGSIPRAEVLVEGGSWGHQQVQARAAGPLGALDGHLSVIESTERGWRSEESSRALRAFGKVGYLRGETDVGLSYQYTADRLEQPGPLPRSLLEQDRSQNYTAGDFFRPTLHLVTLNARRGLDGGLSLAVNAHLRALDAEQFNAGAIAPNTRMFTTTRTWGGAAQVEHEAHWGPLRSHAVAGAEATRTAISVGVSEEPHGAVTLGDDGLPLPQVVGDLSDVQVAVGAFVQERLVAHDGPLAGLGATAALRFDRIAHDIADALPPRPPATENATGRAEYSRWVPALGVSWSFSPRLSASASWSEGFRAPAFLELTCADPQAPCVGLQAGVAPDATLTHLRPVRSRSFEAGVSAAPRPGVTAALNAFRIDLHDDIYGVPGPDATSVYFQNVGDTRREGLEVSLRGERGPVSLEVAYAFTRATFESDVTLATPRTDGGVEVVQPGDRLPMIPEHQLDVEGRVRPRRWLELSAGVHWVGPQFFRGDEANEAATLPAYAVVRAGVEARFGRWSAALRATNLLDARYETFGTFARNARSPTEPHPVEPFLTPAPPLRVFLTLRWGLG